MKKSLIVFALLGVLVIAGPAMAQVKDLSQIDSRLGPPNFSPMGGTNCNSPNAAIPDSNPAGLTDSFNIASADVIAGLTVSIQATHTWVGDLQFTLTHDDTATSALIYDQPGNPASTFGCSGDDIDTDLADANGSSVENACAAAVPTISGALAPSPDALSAFDGESLGGDWSLFVVDNAGGDTGTLNTWCVDNPGSGDGGDGGDGGTGTPATSTWGVIALIALFMAVSLFYLRKRSVNA
jgi:subtilisin-like proprotein convertase family protein